MVRMDDFALFAGRGGGHLLQLHELASRKPFKCVDPWGTRFCPHRNSFRYAVAMLSLAQSPEITALWFVPSMWISCGNGVLVSHCRGLG